MGTSDAREAANGERGAVVPHCGEEGQLARRPTTAEIERGRAIDAGDAGERLGPEPVEWRLGEVVAAPHQHQHTPPLCLGQERFGEAGLAAARCPPDENQ